MDVMSASATLRRLTSPRIPLTQVSDSLLDFVPLQPANVVESTMQFFA